MLNLEGIYKNESVEDVLLHFAPRTSYPSIDRMYVKYNFDVVAKAQFYPALAKLLKEGKLAKNEKGHTVKGPNWQAPKFVTEKKYGIE